MGSLKYGGLLIKSATPRYRHGKVNAKITNLCSNRTVNLSARSVWQDPVARFGYVNVYYRQDSYREFFRKSAIQMKRNYLSLKKENSVCKANTRTIPVCIKEAYTVSSISYQTKISFSALYTTRHVVILRRRFFSYTGKQAGFQFSRAERRVHDCVWQNNTTCLSHILCLYPVDNMTSLNFTSVWLFEKLQIHIWSRPI